MKEKEGHQVTLEVEAFPEDMEPILDSTYRELGGKLQVKGFRKGKIPRKVIDSHLGVETVRTEALRNGLPTLYLMAVRQADMVPVSEPEINLIEEGEDGRVVFEARFDVKPEIEVNDYKGIVVDKPTTEVTDEDVEQALGEARERFATLEVVEGRAVEEGDYVLFDYKTFTDGVPLEGSSGSDRMTEIGSDNFLPGFDEQVIGARKGDILDVHIDFPPDYGEKELAGKPATFRTIVKEIKRKVLPEMTDELASEISQFDTVEEFTRDIRERIGEIKETAADRTVKESAIQGLLDKTSIDLPESMVEYQVQGEIEEMERRLTERGRTLDEYLQAMKGTRHQLEKGIRESVLQQLKAELVLDAVAEAESIEVTEEEIKDYIRERAELGGGDPEKVYLEAVRGGRIQGVRAVLRLNKAAELLSENVTYRGERSPEEPLEEEGSEEGGPGVSSEAAYEEEAEEGTGSIPSKVISEEAVEADPPDTSGISEEEEEQP